MSESNVPANPTPVMPAPRRAQKPRRRRSRFWRGVKKLVKTVVILAVLGVAGLFGLSLAAFFCAAYLCSLTSLGEPFLAPVAPYRPHNPDILLRLPIFRQRRRLFVADPAYSRAAARRVRTWRRGRR